MGWVTIIPDLRIRVCREPPGDGRRATVRPTSRTSRPSRQSGQQAGPASRKFEREFAMPCEKMPSDRQGFVFAEFFYSLFCSQFRRFHLKTSRDSRAIRAIQTSFESRSKCLILRWMPQLPRNRAPCELRGLFGRFWRFCVIWLRAPVFSRKSRFLRPLRSRLIPPAPV